MVLGIGVKVMLTHSGQRGLRRRDVMDKLSKDYMLLRVLYWIIGH